MVAVLVCLPPYTCTKCRRYVVFNSDIGFISPFGMIIYISNTVAPSECANTPAYWGCVKGEGRTHTYTLFGMSGRTIKDAFIMSSYCITQSTIVSTTLRCHINRRGRCCYDRSSLYDHCNELTVEQFKGMYCMEVCPINEVDP